MGEGGAVVSRLRDVRVHVPDVPLLRHSGRDARQCRYPPEELGRVRVSVVHAAHVGAQSAAQPTEPVAATVVAQVPVLPGEIRQGALHRLRSLHPALSGRDGFAGGLERFVGESGRGGRDELHRQRRRAGDSVGGSDAEHLPAVHDARRGSAGRDAGCADVAVRVFGREGSGDV